MREIENSEEYIEGETDEQFAANYADALMNALIDTAAETDVQQCLLCAAMVRAIVQASHHNGHGNCIESTLVGAIGYLHTLRRQDAEQPRH